MENSHDEMLDNFVAKYDVSLQDALGEKYSLKIGSLNNGMLFHNHAVCEIVSEKNTYDLIYRDYENEKFMDLSIVDFEEEMTNPIEGKFQSVEEALSFINNYEEDLERQTNIKRTTQR